ncbi:MAG TPA: Sir2 family NAD-dependent protein deacetylase [Phnomibacter sp.]|nr:Sir2 family NAD-dependent protein deacetylase [Phnomibacter sp.]
MHVVVLKGAGISAESGLQTFRDAQNGLWNGYNIDEVATPEAWRRNPALVLQFYSFRRAEVLKAKPNAAHVALARLEQQVQVTIITQNIDDLHERAGSTQVLHLHGQIRKMRSVYDEDTLYPIDGDIQLGDLAPDGGQLRPHVVWFGEAVPMLSAAAETVMQADCLAIIGTSLQVYPAAGLVNYVAPGKPVYLIDRAAPSISLPNLTVIEKPATLGVPLFIEALLASR